MLREYYRLTKPGIVYGNLFTMLAAFFFATHTHVSFGLLFASTAGVGFVIAGACVFNNYIDRNIDRQMERTKNRALVTGIISIKAALLFGTLLELLGLGLLFFFVNTLTTLIAAFGFVAYLALYGYAKRTSHWGTVVGSISGAVPIVAGYTAVTGRLDMPSWILFLILIAWQMPHFYAIALYRSKEYEEAGIPVLPLKKGVLSAKYHMLGYTLVYLFFATLPSIFGYTGIVYLSIVLFFGLRWLIEMWRGFHTQDTDSWARGAFRLSLIVLITFSFALAVGPLLP